MQQGGSILVKGQNNILFEHSDSGILKTTDVEKVLEVARAAPALAMGEDA